MELVAGVMVLIWLLAAPVLAGIGAGHARRNGLAVAALAGSAMLSLGLTAIYGWPFDTCYTDGGCWEGLILLPAYASLALTMLIFGLATFFRRRQRLPSSSREN